MRLWKTKCERKGHDWLLHLQQEFIPSIDVCLRCGKKRKILPWGWCLGGHPIHEHYLDDSDVPHPVGNCTGPQ